MEFRSFLPCAVEYILEAYATKLRHNATSWKVAGSIPDEIIEFIN
jgi:hypothetical protein